MENSFGSNGHEGQPSKISKRYWCYIGTLFLVATLISLCSSKNQSNEKPSKLETTALSQENIETSHSTYEPNVSLNYIRPFDYKNL